jgi:hypothetical protein
MEIHGQESVGLFSFKKSTIGKILAIRLEELFWARSKMGCSFELEFGLGLCRLHTMAVQVERPWEFMTKGLDLGLGGLAFEGFTLYLAEGSIYYILLAIFSPFLWTLTKIWPLNPTAYRLQWP